MRRFVIAVFTMTLATGTLATGLIALAQQPTSTRASNTGTDPGAPQSAPQLPVAALDDKSTAEQWLVAARSAMALGQTGKAQEAMERAQTRLLDRSVPLFKTNTPSTHPAIPLIAQATRALGAGDRAGAMRLLEQAMPLAVAEGR